MVERANPSQKLNCLLVGSDSSIYHLGITFSSYMPCSACVTDYRLILHILFSDASNCFRRQFQNILCKMTDLKCSLLKSSAVNPEQS